MSQRVELVREASWLRAVAASLLHDRAEAEDLAQDTMLVALTTVSGPREGLRPWLRGVLRNVVKMEARKQIRRRRREQLASGWFDALAVDGSYDQRETEQVLSDAIQALAEPYRSTVMLHFYEGLRASEIGRRLDVPATTVRSRISIALSRLRVDLDRRFGASHRRWQRALLPLVLGRKKWTVPGLGLGAAATIVCLGLAALPVSTRSPAHDPAGNGGSPALALGTPSVVAGGASRPNPEVSVPGATGNSDHDDPWPSSLLALPDGDDDSVFGPERPRLIVRRQDVRRLRAAALRPDAPSGQALRLLAARVERNDPGLLGDARLNYARAHLAQAAAFLYLVTGERRFAQQAFGQIERLYADPGAEPIPHATAAHPLGMATSGVAVALATDWAWTGLTPEQRWFLEAQLERAIDAWASYRYPKLDRFAGSYLVGACRAAELLEILAARLEVVRSGRVASLKQQLAAHLRDGYGGVGLGQGGIEHAAAAGPSLIPALLALRRLGDATLDDEVEAAGLWKLPMFALAGTPDPVSPARVRQLPSRLSNTTAEPSGWSALLFGLVPSHALPAYRRFYDRTWGTEAALPAATRFEATGVGQLWAALLQPDVPAGDPAQLLGRAIADERQGVYFLRSGWTGGDDVLVAVAGDYRATAGGWDAAEAFRLSIFAAGTLFAGGPGTRLGYLAAQSSGRAVASPRLQAPPEESGLASTLLIDGRDFVHRGVTGAPRAFEAHPTGGYVAIDGGSKYRELGVTAQRQVLVDFDLARPATLVSTRDRVRGARIHEVAYQLAPGDLRDVDGVRIEIEREAPVPTFTMRGRHGSYLRGLVLEPVGARLTIGDVVQVTAHGRDVDIWVALLVGRGEPPHVVVERTGDGAVVRLAAGRLRTRDGRLSVDRDRIATR